MQPCPFGLVSARILQDIVDGILKARTADMGHSHALQYQLGDFKSVDSARKSEMDLIRTHRELQRTGGKLREVLCSPETMIWPEPGKEAEVWSEAVG